MTIFPRSTMLALVVLGAANLVARAADTAADQELARDVFVRIVAAAEPVPGWAWPPELTFHDAADVQAYATVDLEREPPQPQVHVYAGIMRQIIDGDENRLAMLLAHELAHITRGHVRPTAGERTPLVEFAATREQEHDADIEGLKLALAAGYSYRDCLGMLRQFIDGGKEYSSFEALNADHPSWTERLAHVDEQQSQLWHAMAAFETGVQFLLIENYTAAMLSFQAVTDDFPKCEEAWVNLGYAQLMLYCDSLDARDIAELRIEPLVVGAFYQRPKSLESLRHVWSEMWFDAVGSLREALRLNPNSLLASANLGLAYLVCPDGRDLGRATRYLDQAAKLAEVDETQPLLARAAIFANAGIADVSAGANENAVVRLARADGLQRAFAGAGQKVAISPTISAAILYHKAMLLARSAQPAERQGALVLLEQYLETLPASSYWWESGYEQYAKLAGELKSSARPVEDFQAKRAVRLRPVTTVRLSGEAVVGVAEGADEVARRLGPGEELQKIAGTHVRRVRYRQHKVSLLLGQSVLGIYLDDPQGPAIELRGSGIATEMQPLKVGITKAALDELLGDQPYDYRQLTDPDVNYRFYRQLGVAARVQKGIVVELIVVQIPERSG